MKKKLAMAMLALACVGCGHQSAGFPDQAPAAGSSSGGGSSGGSGSEPSPTSFTRDCAWAVASDPDLVNIAYPDTAAQYWSAIVPIPPGGEVVIEGEYPHARYMSFNVYNPTLASFEGIADAEIAPDAGSFNPFLPGAERYAEPRRYRLHVLAQPPPDDPAQRQANTLYSAFAPTPAAAYANIIYRIYVSDRGTSLAGNVDLPTFRYLLPGGQELPGVEACAFLEQARLGLGLNDRVAALNLQSVPLAMEAKEPLHWNSFVNAPISITTMAEGYTNPITVGLPIWDPIRQAFFATGLRGGFLSNRDNAYISGTVNQAMGEIAVIASRMPKVPKTYENVPRMAPAQLRYWSLCSNDAPSQRFWDCLYDEQIPQDAEGDYLIVVSRPEMRPANARPECGVAWLDWGPMASSLLILRNMLPDPDFAQAIQNIPAMEGAEREVMGDYYPYGTHASVAEFEALSADPQGAADRCRVDAERLRERARSG
ncbi:MAG: hypothetical protein Q8Q73_11480 [Stagnimonas sp.]|nr:hypothetical protein [Stagnimonas sp.]